MILVFDHTAFGRTVLETSSHPPIAFWLEAFFFLKQMNHPLRPEYKQHWFLLFSINKLMGQR